jgi:hypothetical protein
MAKLAERSRAEDRSLLDYLAILRSSLMHIFLEAQKKGQAYEFALLSSRIVSVLELTARTTGELREHAAPYQTPKSAAFKPPSSARYGPIHRPREAVVQALEALAAESPPALHDFDNAAAGAHDQSAC